METIKDYKKLYNEIPDGYKGEVSAIFPHVNVISRWLNDTEISPDRRAKLNQRVAKVWEWHDMAQNMVVELADKIIVNNTAKITYYELMESRVEEISGCITDPTEIKNLLDNAESIFKAQSDNSPYSLQLLIAKYILR